MRLLLDTQIALWWQIQSRSVPAAARALIEGSEELICISRVSLWEIAIKAARGNLAIDLPQFCERVVADGFEWLEIAERHLLAVSTMPLHPDHKDPFDRLLAAQSLTEPLILLTTDPKLARYGSTIRVV